MNFQEQQKYTLTLAETSTHADTPLHTGLEQVY